MSKTLVIDLPSDLEKQLSSWTTRRRLSLKDIVLQWLTELAWADDKVREELITSSPSPWRLSLNGDIRPEASPGCRSSALAVAGIFSGEPLSAEEIERELYGNAV